MSKPALSGPVECAFNRDPADNPKIYGAGLLSSIGESKSCMEPEVTKLHMPHAACS